MSGILARCLAFAGKSRLAGEAAPTNEFFDHDHRWFTALMGIVPRAESMIHGLLTWDSLPESVSYLCGIYSFVRSIEEGAIIFAK